MLQIAFIALIVLLALFGVCSIVVARGSRDDDYYYDSYDDADYDDDEDDEEQQEESASKSARRAKNKRAFDEAAAVAEEATEAKARKERKSRPVNDTEPASKNAGAKPSEGKETKTAEATSGAESDRGTGHGSANSAKNTSTGKGPKAPEPISGEGIGRGTGHGSANSAGNTSTEKEPKAPKPVSKDTKPEAEKSPKAPESAGKNSTQQPDAEKGTKAAEVKTDNSKTRVITKEEMAKIKAAVDAEPAPASKALAGEIHATDAANIRSADNGNYNNDDTYEEDGDSGFNLLPFIIIGAIVLIALGVIAFILVRNDMARQQGEIVSEPKTITALVDSVREQEEFMGTIECEEPSVRYFTASGKVTKVHVEEGDRVSKGQVIYTLDSGTLEERISLLRQRLEKATVTTQRTVEEKREVTASSGGVITSLYVSRGDTVSEGTAIAVISTNSDYRVSLTFNAEETGTISSGAEATVIVGSTTLSGKVISVSESANKDDDEDEARIYNVTISFQGVVPANANAGASINGVRSLGTAKVSSNSSNTTIHAGVSGKVSELRVSEGDTVSNGQTVAIVSGSSTVSETQTDELAAKDINLQIKQLESELENYSVKADTSGYVKKLYVKADDNAAINQQAAIIIPDGSLYLSVAMDKEKADSMAAPLPAEYTIIHSDEFGEEVWSIVNTKDAYTATVNSIDPDSENPGRFNGHAFIENQIGLRDGMSAVVNVVTYSNFDALLVPAELVKNGKIAIWRANQVVEVPVETGVATDDGYIEITSGITGIDKIVVPEAEEQE